jgi:hypothetical protein
MTTGIKIAVTSVWLGGPCPTKGVDCDVACNAYDGYVNYYHEWCSPARTEDDYREEYNRKGSGETTAEIMPASAIFDGERCEHCEGCNQHIVKGLHPDEMCIPCQFDAGVVA